MEKAADEVNKNLSDYQQKITAAVDKITHSEKWRTVETAVYERDNYQVSPHSWFISTSYVKDCKIKNKRGKLTIEMPTEALDFLFKLHELHFAWESLIELQKSLKNEIRALFDHDPDKLKEREEVISRMESDAAYKNQLLNQKLSRQSNLNEIADKLEKENGELKKTASELRGTVFDLQEALKKEQKEKAFFSDMYEQLGQQHDDYQRTMKQRNKKLNTYDDMFERFPEMASEMKKQYNEQLQNEQRQREKAERKKSEREREYEYTL